MQTFRISKVQEQSYHAIRIFGIVHLIAAVGLVVLLDGPSDGLHGLSWLLILFFLFSSAYLTLRIFQARAGRIHGHYVVTRNTLAILLPGQPRKFVHRKECTGLLPSSWTLVLRNGRHLPLGSVSARPYLKDLVSGVCKAWWPGLHGTPLWAGLLDRNLIGLLDLRVDLRGRPDEREPLLVYTAGTSHLIWQCLGLAACPLLSLLFAGLLYQNWWRLSGDQFSAVSIFWQGPSAVANFIGIVGTLAAAAYIARELYIQRSSHHAFVLSRRRVAEIRAGRPTVYQGADALQAYHPLSGRLHFRSGPSVLAAPYQYGAPYDGMLRMLLLRWRPGHSTLGVQASPSILLGLAIFLGAGLFLSQESILLGVFLAFFIMSHGSTAFGRIDVSVSEEKLPLNRGSGIS